MATVATIIAIILGPILAVQMQKIVERITQKRDEKRKLFMTLLATRARTLSPEHVQALNMIHVVFSNKKKKDQAVVEAWDFYRDHLFDRTEPPKQQANEELSEVDKADYEKRIDEWHKESDELLYQLIRKMADSLGYHFPDLFLKKGAYTPQLYGDMEGNQRIILNGLAQVFLGIRSFPMELTKFPVDEEANKAMKLFLQGKQPLPVSMGLLSEVLDKADKENKSKES